MSLSLPPGEVFRAGLVLLGLALAAWALWRLLEVIFLFLLAILLATAIEPPVKHLSRGPFSRGAGVLVVYTMIVLAIALPLSLLLPSLVAQTDAFLSNLPAQIEALRPYAEQLQPRPLQQAALLVTDRLAAAAQGLGPVPEEDLVEAGATIAHTILNFLLVFVIAFYWLVERATLKRTLLRIVPVHRAREVNAVWIEVEDKFGGWVRGQLILMLAVGSMAGLAFWAIGLPSPVLLAVIAAVAEMIPIIGPFLAFTPAVLVALATDPTRVLLVLLAAAIIQQIEGAILVPRVMSHAVGVSALTVILGVLAGAALYGMAGALLAVPIVGAIQVVLAHLIGTEAPEQREAHAEARSAPVRDSHRAASQPRS